MIKRIGQSFQPMFVPTLLQIVAATKLPASQLLQAVERCLTHVPVIFVGPLTDGTQKFGRQISVIHHRDIRVEQPRQQIRTVPLKSCGDGIQPQPHVSGFLRLEPASMDENNLYSHIGWRC